MHPPVTVTVDSARAVARLSGPLVLGDTYAVIFSGLSTAETAAAPEIVVLGNRPGEIAARSGTDNVLAMTSKPCADAFEKMPPPPFPRPKQFPHPPPTPNPPMHGRGGPHASVRMHFYVVVEGATLAQGDLALLWAPFEYGEAGEPIQLKGEKGEPGSRGEKGDKGEPGRNGVYVGMDGLYAFHISDGTDHPEAGHLWIHAQDESTLYAKDRNGNFLTDSDGKKIPLYYIDADGHLIYRFFYADANHVELDLGRVVTREGLYAFHVSDGTDGEPAGHLMLHGQDLAQLYAHDGQGNLILDADGEPIPLFHIDDNGHLHYTFYGADGQAHESLDLGDVRGTPLTWADLTAEQKASLKGETGATGPQGPQGPALTFADLTPAQREALKGDKGDPGKDGLTEEQIVQLVEETMGHPDDRPVAASQTWVTSGGLWSVEQAILARLAALGLCIDNLRAKIGAALHFKGSVQTAQDLPQSADPGDTYNVVAEGGMNYAWTGEAWDALGGVVDLSGYLTTSAAASTYVPQTRTVNGMALTGDVTLRAEDIGSNFATDVDSALNIIDEKAALSTAQTAVQSVKISGSETELKSGTTATIPVASTSEAGVISSTDKTKLDGIETGANVGITSVTGTSGSGSVDADHTALVVVGSNIAAEVSTNNAGVLLALAVPDGSTSAKGVVQLSSSTSSTSTALAATASAVKAAYDKGDGADTKVSAVNSAAATLLSSLDGLDATSNTTLNAVRAFLSSLLTYLKTFAAAADNA